MASDNAPDTEPVPIYTFDELLHVIHPFERAVGLVLMNFKRCRATGRILLERPLRLYATVSLLIFDSVLQITQICQYVKEARLSEAQQVGAILSIELLALSRGASILLKSNEIAIMVNHIDQIFPRQRYLQNCIDLPKMMVNLKKRFFWFYVYDAAAVGGFSCIPLLKYLIFRPDRSEPVADEFHQNPSWLPFGIKRSHQIYPFMYVVEYMTTLTGFSFLVLWDRMYVILVSLLRLHFEFLGKEILKLNASLTKDPDQQVAFYKHLKELLTYQRYLNGLGQQLNGIFNYSIFFADGVSAMAICFHFYLMLNTNDYMAIALFLLPAMVLIWLVFDISKQATKLEVATSNIPEAIYNHNWYEGSPEYRRHIKMWLGFTYEPLRFYGFQFQVNMAHFQQIMTLTYQMLTFVQSRNTKDN